MNILINIQLINFLGFAIGGILYAMLGLMVLPRGRRGLTDDYQAGGRTNADYLLISVAVCGFIWNIGALAEIIRQDFLGGQMPLPVIALAYSALGLLPALIVHLREQNENNAAGKFGLIKAAAYAMSAVAALIHFQAAFFSGTAPSVIAVKFLAAGYSVILILLLFARTGSFWREIPRLTALLIFIVSLLHLSFPQAEGRSWLTELIGHQASLPLILAILYQNFRFAFADLFLKRALSLVFLAMLVFTGQLLIAAPLAALHDAHPAMDSSKTGVSLLLWMATALAYPQIHRFAAWLVDKVLLRRSNYDLLKNEIIQIITTLEPVSAVLTEVKDRLARALDARRASIIELEDLPPASFADSGTIINLQMNAAVISIPTAESPHFQITLQDLTGGRRLLSDETAMINDIAWHTARRIDNLRVTHERCETELREQEFSSLATEAELRALRAQINPHFLFNALTTIGYLIQTAPEKALATLLQLTGLLRGVLRSTGDFQTLGEEVKLIENYLDIERARFEERLTVEIDVPPSLASIRIPALILQPLVENAVKHGITPKREGGAIRLSAELRGDCLTLRVADSGAGIDEGELCDRRLSRVGLNNVEQRLRLHYNRRARLVMHSAPGSGTTVEIQINLDTADSSASFSASPKNERTRAYRRK